MCVSARAAEFKGTNLYLGKKNHPVHGPIFVLGYQNTAQTIYPGANAMLIHLPTKNLDASNLIDMTGARGVFKDMKNAVFGREMARSFGMRGAVAKGGFQVVEHDIYTVVIADNARVIPEALKTITDPRKQVVVSQDMIEFYARHYKDHVMTLWLFNNRDAKEAAPVFIWYKSFHPDFFMLPGVDAHSGRRPNLSELVKVDHHVYLGSDTRHSYAWKAVDYEPYIDEGARAYLPEFVTGERFLGQLKNGDFVAPELAILESGTEALMRYTPPIQE